MTSLTWRDLTFRDIVTLTDGTTAEVVGVRSCQVHPAGDAQLRLATDTDENDPLWYPVAGLARAAAKAVATR